MGSSLMNSLSVLNKYCVNYTAVAKNVNNSAIYGREQEVLDLMEVLVSSEKKKPVLIGDSGVGKKKIVEFLAYKIACNKVPFILKEKNIFEVDLIKLQLKFNTQNLLTDIISQIIQSSLKSNNVILFFSNLNVFFESNDNTELGNLLGAALSAPSFYCIGSSTPEGFKKIEANTNKKYLQVLKVLELPNDDIAKILEKAKLKIEAYHNVIFASDAVSQSIELSKKYISTLGLPAKAVSILDRAASIKLVQYFNEHFLAAEAKLPFVLDILKILEHESFRQKDNQALSEIEALKYIYKNFCHKYDSNIENAKLNPYIKPPISGSQLAFSISKISENVNSKLNNRNKFEYNNGMTIGKSVLNVAYNKTLNLSADELSVIKFLVKILRAQTVQNNHGLLNDATVIVDVSCIKSAVAKMVGLSESLNSESEYSKVETIEENVKNMVIGQEVAIAALAKSIKRSKAGVKSSNRPVASFLFCGPTGVGKTEIAKALSKAMFGTDKNMIRFDMSEFMEKHSVSRLIGSPPGYVGYGDGGELTEAVRAKPHAIILFDEVEKAHPDVYNIMLQILDDGRLTDTQKRSVSFEHAIIILTSNIGALDIQKYYSNKFFDEELKIEKNFSKANKKNNSGVFKRCLSNDIEKKVGAYLATAYPVSAVLKNIESSNLKILDASAKKNDYLIKENEKAKLVLRPNLMNFFKPEFLNRLDDIIIFHPLLKSHLYQICDITIKNLQKQLAEKNINLSVTKEVCSKLVNESYDPAMGARPLRRAVTKEIEDLLSEHILKFRGATNSDLELYLDINNKVAIRYQNKLKLI